ncbi:hypothetical protein AZI85_15205 [Bdellovibrio bacteriovorus]|uniref:Transglycosylase SLT domain-containing protein n=1 Tax=Bdellovibrio bacteriovorus TaxID=959 RepID=A0A150WU49_BDEBC|nr:lytic transglycosylase domain-containing protein [Bdellovibrio bacteriovorus]KYG70038.1 hypothetical protein AZI85_15205 [Bdellovibrio bacteriovorus]BFD67186.1 hypothetical protein HAGR004_22080 [Bdellovibrio sp. HAGR004]
MPFYLLAGLIGVVFLGFSQKEEIKTVMQKTNGSWTRWDADFKAAAAKWKLWPNAWKDLKAICMNESSLGEAKSVKHGLQYPNDIEASKSYDGKSWGIMQVTLTTAQWLDSSATEAKLNDPIYSIDLAARYLAYLRKLFPGELATDIQWIIKSYNQGPGNSQKERAGTSKGYAGEYWARFQRNRQRVEEG